MEVIRLYVMATCVFSVTNAQVSDDCKNPLGMEDGSIQDSQLTSSSVYNDNNIYDATKGRLDGQSCWIAKTLNQNQWIQVVFDTPMYVSGIILQGTAYKENEWVISYKVQYYFDSSWQYVKGDNQNEMVFRGNTDKNSHVQSLFTSEVRVTRIRIRPTTWHEHISLRLEILGCEDECESSPCVNGQCDGVNQYRCRCNAGWSGTNCDQNINECESHPCVNGRCANGDNQYRCTCNAGWSGTNCDQNINECESNPCENGRCANGDNQYTCTCNAGWSGTNCDQNINECESSPCVNGRCANGDNQYTCTCNAGWSGTNCDQNINECASSPCMNGQCEDGVNEFACTCGAGWTGRVCDQIIDECASSPCMNGKCQDQLNSFTCICQLGYDGTLCDNALTTTLNAAVTTTSSIEASTSNNISDSGSLANQNPPGSASTATGIAIAFVLLLVIIGCVVALIVVKRRRQQRQPQENSNSKNVLQLDGPYGDTITNIITSPPTNVAHIYAGVTGPNGDAVATPPTEELYQDVSDKPGEVQQDMDDTYQDITEDTTQANQGINNDDIYQYVRDNEYAYANVDTERDKVPSVDGDLVQIYAKSQYGGMPRGAENGNQQEGWVDNDIYAISDEDPQLKRQTGGDNKAEGWVENDIYARSDEDQLKRQGGENDKEEGWMDNSIYATTDE